MNIGYRIGVKADQLSQYFPTDLDWRYMLLQAPVDIRFTWYDAASHWAAWEQGVVFGEKAELRWRKRRGGLFHLVLTTSAELPAKFEKAGEASVADIQSLYLWGERCFTPDRKPSATWLEGRIPQIISGVRGYPVETRPDSPPGRVRLQVEVLELAWPPSEVSQTFDPSPPRRWERYVGLVDGPEVDNE